MKIRLTVGPVTDSTTKLVDDSMTLAEAKEAFNLKGVILVNGSPLTGNNDNKTLKELGLKNDQALQASRKDGGN